MRTWILLIPILVLPGCASMEAYQAYQESFDRAAEAYYLAAIEPLIDIELPSPVKGEVYHIVVNRDIDIMSPQQIKDSEWAPVAKAGIGAVGVVGGIIATGNAISDVATAASGVTVKGNNNVLTDVGNTTDNSVFQMQTAQQTGDNNNPGPAVEPVTEPDPWDLIPGCSGEESYLAGNCGAIE